MTGRWRPTRLPWQVAGVATVMAFLLAFAFFPDDVGGPVLLAVVLVLAVVTVALAVFQRNSKPRQNARPRQDSGSRDASGSPSEPGPCTPRVYRGQNLGRKMLPPFFIGAFVGLFLLGIGNAAGADPRFAIVVGIGVFVALAGSAVLASRHEVAGRP